MKNKLNDWLSELSKTLYTVTEDEFKQFYYNLENTYKQLVHYRNERIGPIKVEIDDLQKDLRSPLNIFRKKRLKDLLIKKEEELKNIEKSIKVSLRDEYVTMQALEIVLIVATYRGITLKNN